MVLLQVLGWSNVDGKKMVGRIQTKILLIATSLNLAATLLPIICGHNLAGKEHDMQKSTFLLFVSRDVHVSAASCRAGMHRTNHTALRIETHKLL
jgi:hypothetical protein